MRWTGRRLRLTDIRITGTNKLAFEDVEAESKDSKAQHRSDSLSWVRSRIPESDPFSNRTFEQLRLSCVAWAIASEDAVLQGVSIDGDNLIIVPMLPKVH